ncbi:MAG: DUF255 domain-containing protein [Bacteroidales bacterium]|nr:DUF255 domain-containing protein [Candidatus Colimorpha onthohippi]
MKKNLLIVALFTLLLSSAPIWSQTAKSANWRGIESASKISENTKLYLIDFYTSWCGWCKRMDSDVFTNPTIVKLLDKYYIPVKFNAEGQSQFSWNGVKYSGAAVPPGGRPSLHSFTKAMLGKQLGFPSFAICNTDQSTLTILQGYQPADELIIILWYFASGDYHKYSYEKYQSIFDKDIKQKMEASLKD